MQEFIRVENLWKTYEKKTVLGGVDFSVQENASVAFMGHNGSGKSTLLKIIAGLVRPSKGRVHTGRKLLFHYVPERFPKMEMTVAQYLDYMGSFDKIPKKECKDRIQKLCTDFYMEEMLPVKLSCLSKGTLQKAGVIQALLKKPDVLLLDEPLSGQDADSQRVFIHKMQQLKRENVTILMSCHEPYLMEQVSDVFYELQHGEIVPVSRPERPAERKYELWFEKEGKIQKKILPEKECNSIILQLLQSGWKMKKMLEVEDENTGNISAASVSEKQ